MVKHILFSLFLIVIAAMLQSTLLYRVSIHYAVPDLSLLILVFAAYTNGRLTGELTGFFGGLLLDMFSLSPLGLNMFIRTIIGYCAGLLNGAFFLGKVFFPAALCIGATFLKAGLLFALNLLFSGSIPAYKFSAPVFWIELGLNAALAPFVFALLKRFKGLLVKAD